MSLDTLRLNRSQLATLRAEINEVILNGTSLPAVLQKCADSAVTHLDAALGCLWLVTEDALSLELKARAGAAAAASSLNTLKLGEHGLGRMARDLKPLLIKDLLKDDTFAQDTWMAEAGLLGFAGHPIILDNKFLGVLAIFGKQEFADAHLEELLAVADRISHWMRQDRTAVALRTYEAGQVVLLNLLREQRNLADPEAMMQAAAQAIGEHLQADRVGFLTVPDAETIRFEQGWTAGKLPLLAGPIASQAIAPKCLAEVRAGRTVSFSDARAHPLTADSLLHELGVVALMVVPIIRHGQWHSGLYVHQASARHWTAAEVSLVRDMAEQTWDAIERARTQADLAQTKARLESALQATEIATWTWDLLTNRVFADANLARLLGFNPEDAASGPVEKYLAAIHPQDRDYVQATITKALTDETGQYDVDHRLIRPDNSVRWVTARGKVEKDSAGKPIRFPGVVMDITARRRDAQILADRARLADLRVEISNALLAGQTLPEVLQSCADSLVKHLDVACAGIWTLGQNGETLELRASAGVAPQMEAAQLLRELGEANIGRIAQSGKPLLINDVPNDAHLSSLEQARKEGLVAFAGYPLLLHERALGVLAIFARQPFSETVLSELSTLSGSISQWLQRKFAEAALRESEERYRSLFNSMDEGFCIIEVLFDENQRGNDYRFLEINPAFEKQTGLKSALGKRILEIAPALEKKWFEIYGRVALTGEAIRFQNRAETLGRWFDVFAFRIGQPEQRRVAILFNDITARRISDKALFESEERFRALVNQATTGMVQADAEGRMVLVNQRWCDMLGYSEMELIGKSILEVTDEEFVAETVAAVQKLAAGSGPFEIEKRYQRKDGSSFWASSNVNALWGSHGEYKGLVAIVFDNTARRAAEQGLVESEKRFRLLADNMSQLAWMAEANGVVFWYNRRWYDYTGTTLADMRGWACVEVHHPDHIASVVAKWEANLKTGGDWEDTFPLRGKDGSFRWFLSRAFPIRDAQGKIERWFGTNTDITDLRIAQEAVARAQQELAEQNQSLEETVRLRTAKLEETIHELEAFSFSISHDMRSPLRAMHGYSQTLLAEYKDKLDATGTHYLERISRGAARLDLLIRDVLAYSKVTKEEVELTAIDLEHLIHDVIHNYPDLQPPKLQVSLQPLPAVIGHEVLLTQIVSNLLGNATKFARPGVSPEVRISAEIFGSHVKVWFADNGIGISPQHYEQIFQIFGRIHSEKTYSGTGIGLAIVRKAVERMNGNVGLTSKVGVGSSFWITLRLA